MTLEGGTAVVTGATGAVGGAIAARLLAAGMTVCATGASPKRLEDLVATCACQDRIEPFQVDLTDEFAICEFCRRIEQRHRSVNVLVHCAGVLRLAPIVQGGLADLDLQYRVNVRAPFQLTQALLPLITNCGGQVVFINSSAGMHAHEGAAQYAATKHALRALADSLRAEVNNTGVRVMSVFLGRMASRMQAAVHAHEGRPYNPERLLQPDDVAGVIVNALQVPATAEVTDIHIRQMLKS